MHIVYRDLKGHIIRLKCDKLEARLPASDIYETFAVPDLEIHVLETLLPMFLSICFQYSEDFIMPGVFRPVFLDMSQARSFVASGFLSEAARKRIEKSELYEIFPSWGSNERVYSSESVTVTLYNRTGTISFPIKAEVVRTEDAEQAKFEKMRIILGKDFAYAFMRSISGNWREEGRGQLYFLNRHRFVYKTSFEEKRVW